MTRFVPNTPVSQPDPVVQVDVTAAAPLPLGANRFQLIVVDDSGNESAPAFLDVIVKDTDRPTAVLDLVNATGRVVTPQVSFGQPFILSGGRSADLPPGKVVEYRFTLVS